jgi:hypothetical protein
LLPVDRGNCSLPARESLFKFQVDCVVDIVTVAGEECVWFL